MSIVGPNGSGKTTLFKLLLGVKKAKSGSIEFLGEDALESDAPNSKHVRSYIGYVPQAKTLDKKFPATALELVLTGVTGCWTFYISKKKKKKWL